MWGELKFAVNSTVGAGMKTLDKISVENAVEAFYNSAKALKLATNSAAIYVCDRGDTVSRGTTTATDIKQIAIPPQAVVMGSFNNCTNLTEVYAPCIQELGNNCFQSCTKLKSIVLGKALNKIGVYVFHGISNITIYYHGTKAEWNAITKGDGWDTGLTNYTVKCLDGDIAKG